MQKRIAAIIFMVIATTANATGNDHGKPDFPNSHDNRPVRTEKPAKPAKPSHPGKPASPSASSNAVASAGAIGIGVGIGVGGQGGNGGIGGSGGLGGQGGIGGNSAGGSATSGDAVASIAPMAFSFTSNAATIPANQRIETSGTVTVRQTAAIAHQLGSPTASCRDVIGIGGAAPGGSGLLSFNLGVDWCRDAELSRQARIHGMNATADDLFCNIDRVKELNTPDCAASRKRAEENSRAKPAQSESQNVAFSSAG